MFYVHLVGIAVLFCLCFALTIGEDDDDYY